MRLSFESVPTSPLYIIAIDHEAVNCSLLNGGLFQLQEEFFI